MELSQEQCRIVVAVGETLLWVEVSRVYRRPSRAGGPPDESLEGQSPGALEAPCAVPVDLTRKATA